MANDIFPDLKIQDRPKTKGKIKTLIVDDSAVVRQTLREVLSSDPDIEVMSVAGDPYMAAEKMKEDIPDVIVLDLEMPRMDGLTFLKKIMQQHPLPVVICSSLSATGSQNAVRAMEYGAVEIIQKPRIGTKLFIEESKTLICDAVKAAGRATLKRKIISEMEAERKYSADVMMLKAKPTTMETTDKVIVVGASTGGTEALRVFLEALPLDSPGAVIVQHMPEHFTKSFAGRLNEMCRVSVEEAADGDAVLKGRALIAPGNRHILLRRNGARYFVEVKDGPLVNRHRPSVDVLFRSAARFAGKNAVGVIMTGMGDDGAAGLLEMKEAGAFNIAQDEESSVVFGMPQAAIKNGSVDEVLPLESIAAEVLKRSS